MSLRRAWRWALLGASALVLTAVLAMASVIFGAVQAPAARWAVAQLIGVNFGEVEPGVFRGGRPTGWRLAALQRMYGFDTVVHLAWAGHEVDRAEEAFFEASGARYHHLPWRPDVAAPSEDIEAAVALIADAPRPIYIHCIGGKDRTGGLVGRWRLRGGAPLDAVREDWVRYGRPSAAWQRAIEAAAEGR